MCYPDGGRIPAFCFSVRAQIVATDRITTLTSIYIRELEYDCVMFGYGIGGGKAIKWCGVLEGIFRSEVKGQQTKSGSRLWGLQTNRPDKPTEP